MPRVSLSRASYLMFGMSEAGGAMTEEMDSCEKILSARAYLYLLFHKLYGGEPTEELMDCLL